MRSKKTLISSKKPQGRNITLSDGTKVKTNDNTGKNIKRGQHSKHVTKKKFSTETGMKDKDWKVTDDLDNSEWPPQSRHPLYRKYWAETIADLTSRTNFKPAHLGLLDAYCRLRVELNSLDEFIMTNGHTFRVVTVLGEHRKTYPEVGERMKVLSQLGSYSRMLDLIPKKDKSKGKSTREEEEEWG